MYMCSHRYSVVLVPGLTSRSNKSVKEGSEGEDRGREINSQAEVPQDEGERGGLKAEGEQVITGEGPTEDEIHVSIKLALTHKLL